MKLLKIKQCQSLKSIMQKSNFKFGLIIIVLSLFVFQFNVLYSQTTDSFSSEIIYGETYKMPLRYEGSPYLIENWSNCNVSLKNGKVAENVKVKLCILSNNLVYYNEQLKNIFKIDKNTVDSFVINPGQPNSRLFVVYQGSYSNLRLNSSDIVEVLHNGKISFWAKHTSDVISATELNKSDKIYPKTFYFLSSEKGISDVSLSIGSIKKVFPEHKKEIKAIQKENRIKRRSAQNISKLIALLNERLFDRR